MFRLENAPAYEKAKSLIEGNLNDFALRNYQNFHAMIDTFNQKYKLPQQFESIIRIQLRKILLMHEAMRKMNTSFYCKIYLSNAN